MRKTAILIAFVLLAVITKAQKSRLFKFKYLPAHTYELTTKTGMDLKIGIKDVSVNAEKNTDTTSKLTNMVVDTEWETTVRTDGVTAGSIPIAILSRQFSMKATLNGTESPRPEINPLQGLTVKGKIDKDGKMFLDTATATSEIKSVIGTLTGGMPEQLKFPDQQLKVGDTFSQDANLNAMNLPDFGIDMDYPTKVIYKLTAVKDNLAYFDVTSELKMNINREAQGKTVNIQGKGTGTGKMEFYMDKGYPKSTINNVEYFLNITGPNTKADIKWNLTTDAKYVVNSN
nr:hypothetical protein [Pedobacter panaciterrae]